MDSPKTEFSLTIHNDKITALIDKAPLYEVLGQLAQRFRFKLHFQETQRIDIVSAQLRETTLEEALRKLLIGKDYAMVKSGPSRGEAESDSGLAVLFVLTRDNGSQSPPHPFFDAQSGVESGKPITPQEDSGDTHYVEQAKIDQLEEKLLLSDDPLTREAAAEVLADLHTPEAEQILGLALHQDLDEFVRETAAKALGDSWDPKYLDDLTEALFNDPSIDVRTAAAEAMGEIGEPSAISALQKALDDGNPEVRESAVQALGDFADPQAISLLRGALADPDSEVRRSAAFHLQSLKGIEK